jgi:hypothetical protein
MAILIAINLIIKLLTTNFPSRLGKPVYFAVKWNPEFHVIIIDVFLFRFIDMVEFVNL